MVICRLTNGLQQVGLNKPFVFTEASPFGEPALVKPQNWPDPQASVSRHGLHASLLGSIAGAATLCKAETQACGRPDSHLRRMLSGQLVLAHFQLKEDSLEKRMVLGNQFHQPFAS